MNSRTLTLATLRKHKACKEQHARFEQHFGASVEITPELCESVAVLFNWDWTASHLLSAAEYQRVTAPVFTRAWRLAYERIEVLVLECERIKVLALECDRAMARAFATQYIKNG